MKNYINEFILWVKTTKVGKLALASLLAISFTCLANLWEPFIYAALPFWLGLLGFTLYAIGVAIKNTFKND